MEFKIDCMPTRPWALWYAWYPVVVYRRRDRRKVVWLEYVWRETDRYGNRHYKSTRVWKLDARGEMVKRDDIPLREYDWES